MDGKHAFVQHMEQLALAWQPVPHKACPVLLRRSEGGLELLAFEHPLAGLQIVKGGIEAGEGLEAAALRELAEESGITDAVAVQRLGLWSSGHEGQVWAFVGCHVPRTLPDRWVHDAPDDGGRRFRFFWHPLLEPADPSRWHGLFRGALDVIRGADLSWVR
jgi:8-oxo-dGTP pyrophosphatase MutT (NUDIX family)